MNPAARHYIFKGHVQGVGFRYTVRQIASALPITGFVRNLPDRTVEAVFQGADADMDACIQKIRDAFGSYIRSIDASPMVFNPAHRDFDIAF